MAAIQVINEDHHPMRRQSFRHISELSFKCHPKAGLNLKVLDRNPFRRVLQKACWLQPEGLYSLAQTSESREENQDAREGLCQLFPMSIEPGVGRGQQA